MNFNKLTNLPEQVTADGKSSICYFVGKLSDNPEDIDWIQTIFKHKQARTKSENYQS